MQQSRFWDRVSAFTLVAFLLVWVPGALWAGPDEGADLTLPSSVERYVPGIVTGEATEVDRRMEVTEKEGQPQPAVTAPKPEVSHPGVEEESFFTGLIKNKTFLNILILVGILSVFIVYRLRSSSRR